MVWVTQGNHEVHLAERGGKNSVSIIICLVEFCKSRAGLNFMGGSVKHYANLPKGQVHQNLYKLLNLASCSTFKNH